MELSAGAQILIINAVIVGVAYFGIYPTIDKISREKMMLNDGVLSCLSLVVAGGLFWGTGIEFSMHFFTTNWFWFTIVTLLLLEVPLFFWFCRKHNISLFDFDDFDGSSD